MIFIDTHVVIWLYQKTLDLLSSRAKDAIEKNDIFISPIVSLEIEYLYEIKKINKGSKTIIKYLQEKIGLKIDDAGFEDVIARALSEKWTRDPFDRIITAHARQKNAFLITRDEVIKKNYKKTI